MDKKLEMIAGCMVRMPPPLADDTNAVKLRRPFELELDKALRDSFAELRCTVDKTVTRLDEIVTDANLSDQGKKAAARKFLEENAAGALKKAASAIQRAEVVKAKLRDEAAVSSIDKADLAGAVLRSEIRAWVRSLDEAKRAAMLTVHEDLDLTIAAAIQEAPAALSGVTQEQHERLCERAVLAYNPDLARKVAEVDATCQAVSDMARALTKSLTTGSSGLTELDVRWAAGEPACRVGMG